MHHDIAIKKIGTDEIPLIVSLADRIWPATYSEILSPDQIAYMMELFYQPASLRSQMTDKGHQFIIALQENEAMAFASYSATKEAGIYRLHKIYVDTAMQGRGVGRQMIDYIFADEHFRVKQFNRVAKRYSDHYMLVSDMSLVK